MPRLSIISASFIFISPVSPSFSLIILDRISSGKSKKRYRQSTWFSLNPLHLLNARAALFILTNFSTDCLRHLICEFNYANPLVFGEPVIAEAFDFLRKLFIRCPALPGHNKGFNSLPTQGVLYSDYTAFHNSGMQCNRSKGLRLHGIPLLWNAV